MAFKLAKPKLAVNEVEWKSNWWHERINKIKSMSGIHDPIFHKDPFSIQPRLRPDGKTYCDKCDLKMVPFDKLKQVDKDDIKAIVLDFIECDDEYKKFINGHDS